MVTAYKKSRGLSSNPGSGAHGDQGVAIYPRHTPDMDNVSKKG